MMSSICGSNCSNNAKGSSTASGRRWLPKITGVAASARLTGGQLDPAPPQPITLAVGNFGQSGTQGQELRMLLGISVRLLCISVRLLWISGWAETD